MDFQHPEYIQAEEFAKATELACKQNIRWMPSEHRHQMKLKRAISIPCIIKSTIEVTREQLEKHLNDAEQPSFSDSEKRKKLIGHLHLQLQDDMINVIKTLIGHATADKNKDDIINSFFTKPDILTLRTFYKDFQNIKFSDIKKNQGYTGVSVGGYEKSMELVAENKAAVVQVKLVSVCTDDKKYIQRSEIDRILVY